ncbi:unnamed protein product, partial [Vitis vinifera]|uniref:Secreted protein n=1 Tax=Vitis vinifera TaxID=29760 RepID=D7TH93_VITVI
MKPLAFCSQHLLISFVHWFLSWRPSHTDNVPCPFLSISLQISHGRTHTRSPDNRFSITKSPLLIFSIRNPRRFFQHSSLFSLNFCNFSSTNPFCVVWQR